MVGKQNAAEELDDGDPHDLARHYEGLLERLPDLDLLGGSCGTDSRQFHAIAVTWLLA